MDFVVPEGNGVRLLSLDGGDAQCISQFIMLDELMSRLKHDLRREVRPCEYFHSINGVGGSGVMAILLGVLGLSINEATQLFGQLCEHVFPAGGCTEDERSNRLVHSAKQILDGLHIPHTTRLQGDLDISAGCHVSICYSAAANTRCRVFRNYESRQSSYNPTLIEAVRVAWATPGLFSSIRVGAAPMQEELISAVNGTNNPTLEAIREAQEIFGKDRMISSVLSLGNGRRDNNPRSPIATAIQIAQETEITAENLQRRFGNLGVYFRFSMDCGVQGKPIDMEDHFGLITSYTREYLGRDVISRSLDNYLKQSGHTSTFRLDALYRTRSSKSSSHGLPPLSSFFVMRQQPLNKIAAALASQISGSPAIGVVTGMSGTGKTQISLKYAYDNIDQYDHIIFIDASSVESMEKTLITRIQSIDRQLRPANMEEALDLLVNPEGNLTRNWLIIMDNADDTKVNVSKSIPSCDHGCILITSRNVSLGDFFPDGHIILDVMALEEAVDALLSAALGPKAQSRSDIYGIVHAPEILRTEKDRETAIKIVEDLGCLPLAVIQAACYIKKQKCLHEYPALLQTSRSKILRWPASIQRDTLEYAHSTYAAFDTTLSALSSRALTLLGIISFFHFSDFPRALIPLAASLGFDFNPFDLLDRPPEYQHGVDLLQETLCPDGHWDPIELDSVLEELQAILCWANDRLSQSERFLFQAAAIRLLVCGTNEDDYLWPYLSPHIGLLSLTSDQLHVNDKAALVAVLRDNGQTSEYLAAWESIHAAVKDVHGDNHIRTKRAELHLADAYSGEGDLDRMEAMERNIVKVQKDILGQNHSETVTAMANLARTFRWKGERYHEAVELELEVLRVRRDLYGPMHREIVQALSDLAATYTLQGDFVKAHTLLEEASEMIISLVGQAHIATIRVLEQRAYCFRRSGDNNEAIALTQKIIGLWRVVRGELHASTLKTMELLAESYWTQGQYRDAEMMWRKVVYGRREIAGDQHQLTLNAISNLAILIYSQNRFAETEALLTKAVVTLGATLGDRHEQTITGLFWLAHSVYSQERYAEAEVLWNKLLASVRITLGDRHSTTLDAKQWLARSIGFQGRAADAEAVWRELADDFRITYGNQSNPALIALFGLGGSLYDQKRLVEAEEVWREVENGRRITLGDTHEDTLFTLHGLGRLILDQNRFTEAELLWREVVLGWRKTLGDQHKDTLEGLFWLSTSVQSQGRYEDAEALWMEVVDGRRATMGDTHEDTLKAQEALSETRRAMGVQKKQQATFLNNQAEHDNGGSQSPRTDTGTQNALPLPFPSDVVAGVPTLISTETTQDPNEPVDPRGFWTSVRKITGYTSRRRSRLGYA